MVNTHGRAVNEISQNLEIGVIGACSQFCVEFCEISLTALTHGHPDHVGNNNLFTGAEVVHVMGHSIHTADTYNVDIDFKAGDVMEIDGAELQVQI